MSYIAYELDAMNKAPSVARAARVSEDSVHGGLLRMWAHCFREKTDRLVPLQVRGFFCTEADVIPALEAFGFLEADGDGYRIRGARRYLRIAEGLKKGGMAAKGNLIPGGPKRKKPAEGGSRGGSRDPAEGGAETQPRPSRDTPSAPPGLPLGLSPTTDDRIVKSTGGADKPPAARQRNELADALSAAFRAVRLGEYRWSKADWVQLAELRKTEADEEIVRRWRVGISLNAFPGLSTVAELPGKWNHLATLKPAAPASKGDIVDKCVLITPDRTKRGAA